jgi:uncharacterized secreted protein with C-terminal beta-propeller domain
MRGSRIRNKSMRMILVQNMEQYNFYWARINTTESFWIYDKKINELEICDKEK